MIKSDSILVECQREEYFNLFNTHKPDLVISKTCTFSSERPYSRDYRYISHSFNSSNVTFIAAERDTNYVKYYKNEKF